MRKTFIIIEILVVSFFLVWITACKKKSTPVKSSVKTLEKKIDKESKELGPDHWVGSYYEGDGLGVNKYLDINPEADFTFKWRGCLGLYDHNHGKVRAEKDRLLLSFDLPKIKEGFQGLEEEFIVVRWGKRTYLIPPDKMIDFTNAVNCRMEPRDCVHGFFFLRKGDHEIEVDGKPEISEEYLPYLLEKPISAEVTQVFSSTQKQYGTEVIVEINVGNQDGVLKGMEFNKINEFYIHAEVIEVMERSSKAVIKLIVPDDLFPEKGWKFSTEHLMTEYNCN